MVAKRSAYELSEARGVGGTIFLSGARPCSNCGVELGPNARCFVSEFTAVCAWPTLDETNRYQTVIVGGVAHVLSLPAGSYDLDSFADALQTALRDVAHMGFIVERAGVGTGSTQQLLRVSNSLSFMLADSPR